MYRQNQQHQQLYSQADKYHIRKPEQTLFEDSPQNKSPYGHDNLFPRNQEYLNRLGQNEESGGVLLTSEGGGRDDDRISHNSDEGKEGENDIEYIIMNLYSKMKNLENKYIDLANFYKQELVKNSSVKRLTEEDQESHIYGQQHIRPSGLTPSKSFDRSPDHHIDQSPGKDSPGRMEQPSESEIIRDLIEEKKKLEDDMKQMITMRGSQYNQASHLQQSPQRQITDFNNYNAQQPDQVKLLKQQLLEALSSVIDSIDTTQKKELQVLTSKQNDMYQLASKYNLPQNLRNETLGLWYDAKTKLTACMGELKSSVQLKQRSLSTMAPDTSSKVLDFEGGMGSSQDSTGKKQFFVDFEKELTQFRRKAEYINKNVQKLKNSLRYKESALRDDQAKLSLMIRDVYKSISSAANIDRMEQQMLSGEKGHHGMMSPFEKRLATYQKSAEMRKQGTDPLNRSGSRGRPGVPSSNTGINFYRPGLDFNNNQQNFSSNPDQEPDNRILKSKVKELSKLFGDFNAKINLKSQDEQELERMIDSCLQDQSKFVAYSENLMNYHSTQQTQPIHQHKDVRSKSKGAIGKIQDNFYTPTSPTSNQYQTHDSAGYMSNQRQNVQDKKLSELQKNNDQLFSDLRKTNEKYLNQRVESNKLKDDIKILQNALEDAQSQIKKLQTQAQQQLHTSDPGHRQQIRKKTHSSRPEGSQGRQSSSNPVIVSKENEDLKKRVQELEKECFTLTYYQQEQQRKGGVQNLSDPQFRGLNQDNLQMKNRIDQLCIYVQKFLFAMKKLQRAVNTKDKDMPMFKTEFEQSKKALEYIVKETKEQQDDREIKANQYQHQTYTTGQQMNTSLTGGAGSSMNHHSMLASWDKRDPRFADQAEKQGGHRGRSQVTAQSTSNLNRSKNQIPMYPASQRPEAQEQQVSQSQFYKKGIIRPKNQLLSPQSQGRYDEPFFQQNESSSQQPIQEQEFYKLLEDVKLMQEEGDKQRQQIEELKSMNEELLAEKNASEIKFNSKQINIQKLTQQLKQSSDRIWRQEKLLNEYKEGLQQLEQSKDLNKFTVTKVKTELLMRERELLHAQLTRDNSSSTLSPSQRSAHQDRQQEIQQLQQLHQQQQVYQQQQIQQLREDLTIQIRIKEEELENQLDELQTRLSEKEEDLAKVKKLFVEKLREIETSFAELSQEMVENEQVQLEASKRYQQQQILQQSQYQLQTANLEKSLENVMGKIEDDQREEDLDKLVQANEELQETNTQLRARIKQLEKEVKDSEELKALREEYAMLRDENNELEGQIKLVKMDEQKLQKEIQQQKGENKKLQAVLHETTLNKEKVQSNFQAQINELEAQMQEIANMLQQEQEQRVFFQSEYNNKDKQLKVAKNEKQSVEKENERLIKRETELLNQIDQVKQEQEYMVHLRKQNNDDQEDQQDQQENEGDNSVDSIFQEEQENAKIEENPLETAQSYLRMLKATKKEFKILSNAHEKLQEKFQELKDKYADLKQETRKSVEQIMNMESTIFDLDSQNQKLMSEIEKAKGDYKVDEESLKNELEDQYKERIAFKESEIESMTSKLSRISQTNIELNSKCVRLESCNQELTSENDIYRNKVSALEMELEMTKSNSERDTDHLVQQEKSKYELELIKLESDRAKEQTAINEKLKSIETQRQQLESKLGKKKEKLNTLKNENEILNKKHTESGGMAEMFKKGLEQKLNNMQKELEAEKKAREESELKRQQQVKQQEEERLILIQEQENDKKLLEERYKEELSHKDNKQKDIEKQRELREQELIQKHQHEKERLEQRLKEEREQQENRLKEGEKEKIERVRKEMEEERNLLIQEREEQLKYELEQHNLQQLQELQQTLEQQNHNALQAKEQEKTLALKMQDQVRKNLEEQLQQAIRDTEEEAIRQQQEQEQLREEYENEMKQLEELRKQELQVLEQKLKKDHDEKMKKEKKQMTLVQVLQMKARESILKQLEEERLIREQEQLRVTEEMQRLKENELKIIQQKEQEKAEEIEQALKKLESAKHKEIQGKEQEKSMALQMKDKLLSEVQSQLEQARSEHLKQVSQIEEELHVAKKEHEDLIHSLSLNKDQQTQELLAQKDLEKEHLIEELTRKHEKELLDKEKQSKLVLTMQEKIRKDLEQKLADNTREKEEAIKEKEAEMERAREEQRKLLDESKKKSKEEQEKLKKRIDEEAQLRQNELKAMEQELEEAREDQRKTLDKFNKSKQDEIDQLKKKLQDLVLERDTLINDHQLELHQLSEEHSKTLNDIRGKHKSEQEKLQKILADYQKEKEQTIHEKELVLEKTKNEHQLLVESLETSKKVELENIRQRLENDHKELMKKKDTEKSLFEKLQEKVREELKAKLEQKEQENANKQLKVQELELEISKKEQEIENERINQQELIDQLSQQVKDMTTLQNQLKSENDKVKKELENLKKQSNESENGLIKELRSNLDSKTQECDTLNDEKKKLTSEVQQLKASLQQKQKEIANLEKDIDQIGLEIDQEKQQNEGIQEQINKKLQEVQTQKDTLEKQKKETDLQMKMKEGLLKKVQEQAVEHEQNLNLKSSQLQEIQEKHSSDKQAMAKLEQQLQELKLQHEKEMKTLKEEHILLSQQLQKLNSPTKKNNVNQSIDEIETRLGEFNIELNKMKEMNKDLERQKQLNDSLMETANEDSLQEEVINDIGQSDQLQYCKRVKYQEKAWILVFKSNKYHWIDQDKVPINKLQTINVESMEEAQDMLQIKLKELTKEKDNLVKMVRGDKGATSSNPTQSNKAIEIDLQELKQQLNDLKVDNNNLQQANLQLKARINELNDMIFGLAETDQKHDSIKKFVELHKKSEELSSKLMSQFEVTRKLETENETLKKQVQEMDYSFAQGGKSFATKPEGFNLETSSIVQQPDDDDFTNIQVDEASNNQKRLESDIEELHRLKQDLEKSNKTLKDELEQHKAATHSTMGVQQNHEAEMQDHLKHTRSILIKFLEKMPTNNKESEALLPIIYSLMYFTREEQEELKKIRNMSTEKQVNKDVKKSVFGMFGNKK